MTEPSPLRVSVPLDGLVTTAALSGLSTSASFARTPGALTLRVPLCSTENASPSAIGASLTEATVIATVAMFEVAVPSLAR
jgi:hypothetical protein